MSRYQRLDSDEENLPHGLERSGYDADSQQYTYRDRNTGALWQGPQGARYGELRHVGESGITNAEHDQNQQVKYPAAYTEFRNGCLTAGLDVH